MSAAATLGHDALLPRPPGGNLLGAVLALGGHAALLFAFSTAIQWRIDTPQVVSAELWASVPEAAAPALPPPAPPAPAPAQPPPTAAPAEPPPPKVDIATERAERAQAARERREAEAEAARKATLAKAEAEKKRREDQAQQAREENAATVRAEQAREEQLRRMMSQAGATASAPGRGSASRDAAPSASYTAKLVALIRGNTVFSGEVAGNPAAEVEVRAAANGSILSRRLVKSSGHAAWDEAVLRAIDRVGTLPRDSDGRVPPTLIVAFRPKE